MKEEKEPKPGQAFFHKEYNEVTYFERLMPDGNYLCCNNPKRREYDDYYSYNPKVLKRLNP